MTELGKAAGLSVGGDLFMVGSERLACVCICRDMVSVPEVCGIVHAGVGLSDERAVILVLLTSHAGGSETDRLTESRNRNEDNRANSRPYTTARCYAGPNDARTRYIFNYRLYCVLFFAVAADSAVTPQSTQFTIVWWTTVISCLASSSRGIIVL